MRILILLLFAVIAVACQNGKTNDESDNPRRKKLPLTKRADQYQKEFQRSMRNGDTTSAIKALERYHKLDSSDTKSRMELAVLKFRYRQISRAEATKRMQKIYENAIEPWIEYMYLDFIVKDATPAQEVSRLDSVITKNPNRSVFHIRRAHTLMDLQRFDDAIESFTVAANLEPGNMRLRAERNLALYRKGDVKNACAGWTAMDTTSMNYYEQYCKWPELEKVWNEFISNPGRITAEPVQTWLSHHSPSVYPEDEQLSQHLFGSWMKLSQRTQGNEMLLDIGFGLLRLMKDEQHYRIRCELAKSIAVEPKTFLTVLSNHRNRFQDFNEIAGAFDKELMNDKKTQLREVEKRIIALNTVNTPDLIHLRGECLLALEKKRERLLHP